MWFIFPKVAGLVFSAMSRVFAIRSATKAAAYLAHPVLGPRLRDCAAAILSLDGLSARDVLGTPDDMKLRSSTTLFASVLPAGLVFHRVLERYYGGEADQLTLRMLAP